MPHIVSHRGRFAFEFKSAGRYSYYRAQWFSGRVVESTSEEEDSLHSGEQRIRREVLFHQDLTHSLS